MIRNIAISGVETTEQYMKVVYLTEGVVSPTDSIIIDISRPWVFDDASQGTSDFMYNWPTQENHLNFKNCRQMTYEEFIEEFDNADQMKGLDEAKSKTSSEIENSTTQEKYTKVLNVDDLLVERKDFISLVSAIVAMNYTNGRCAIRLKHGAYIHEIIMSKEEFNELKTEYKEKLLKLRQ